jgi:solute carrier family 7 (cationic amino acid transporter), member 1
MIFLHQVRNPRRDIPMGIGLTLSLCCTLYMMVSVVIVGLVPYAEMDLDTPISTAFVENGMH